MWVRVSQSRRNHGLEPLSVVQCLVFARSAGILSEGEMTQKDRTHSCTDVQEATLSPSGCAGACLREPLKHSPQQHDKQSFSIHLAQSGCIYFTFFSTVKISCDYCFEIIFIITSMGDSTKSPKNHLHFSCSQLEHIYHTESSLNSSFNVYRFDFSVKQYSSLRSTLLILNR